MLTLVLTQPMEAFTEYKIQGSGAQVSGGGYVYKLKEFCPNPEFDNGISPWGWIQNEDFVENPSNQAETVFDEAYSGHGSASLTFNVNTQWFGINLSSSTNRGNDIANSSLNVSAYIKTNFNNLNLVFHIPNVTTQSVPIASTAGQWALRNAVFSVPNINNQDKIFVGIYCSGTATAFVDLFSVTVPAVFSDIVDHSYVIFTPGWNVPALINATDYSGFYLYFINGPNQKILAPIHSIVITNGLITRIDVYDILPYVTTNGTLVSVLRQNNQYAPGNVYTISDGILECETETAIDVGYSSAQISLLKESIYSTVGHTDLLMWRGIIKCEYGEIFDGIITAIDENEEKCDLSLSGFSFFLANQNYAGYFPSSSNVTTKSVLLDMVRSVSVLQAQNPIIDRDNAISSVQFALGGIGPLDFSDGNQKIKDCIDKILKLGTYDNTFDALFLQIYSGGVPVLVRIPRKILMYQIAYFADHNNLRRKISSKSVNLNDFKTVHYATYSAPQGEQAETSLVGELKFLKQYGTLINNISSGNLAKEEAYLILQNMIFETERANSISTIELSGMLSANSNGLGVHVSQIRAGDIIMLNGEFYEFSDRSGLSQDYGIIIVGSTKYDAFEEIVTITPYIHETNVESMLSLLEIK